jgi:hypothetical protein
VLFRSGSAVEGAILVWLAVAVFARGRPVASHRRDPDPAGHP